MQKSLLIDMAPTILAALQALASIEHTGRVSHEVVASEALVTPGEKANVTIPGITRPEESNDTNTEAEEMRSTSVASGTLSDVHHPTHPLPLSCGPIA